MSIHVGSILPVGTVIHSMLTTTQFAAEYGDNWVLADGRSVTGSRYATVTGSSTVPDMRGVFLRGKGATYNPDGDLALGTYTADKYSSHTHTIPVNYSGSIAGSSAGYDLNAGSYSYSLTSSGASGSGNETAPKSVTVNIFIRIN